MKQTSEKILILGGSGFIGRNLTERLISEGCNVRVFKRSGEKNKGLKKLMII